MELETPQKAPRAAVLVRRAYKKYGRVKVLEGLDMTVQQGTVYGMLGASGCGKTTLLNCVVGRRELDSGDILVMGLKPGTKGCGIPGKRVGFMPQETALCFSFTVRQTMRYFGLIFDMASQDVQQRTDALLSLLDIPYPERMVKNLSGGQMRRVSFAVALLHDPEILVLDEPTVGMDPVLRDVIWQHLMQLACSRGKTIILTTHYIEEARKAHRVGLMRNGRLLDEDCADVLMSRYLCGSLEDVFLKLSSRQEQGPSSKELVTDKNNPAQDFQEDDAIPSKEPMGKEQQPKKLCFGMVSKGSMKALIFKNLVSVFRDPYFLSFIFGLCVLAVSCVYMGFGSEPHDLRVAVVNHDRGSLNPRCVGVEPPRDCRFENLSCHYLAQLNKSRIVQEFHDNYESALEAVRSGKAWGSLYFSENFTTQMTDRLIIKHPMSKRPIEDSSNVQVRLDMSDQVISLLIQRELALSFVGFAKRLLAACNYTTKLADLPINFKAPVYGSSSPTFLDFTAPGVMVLMMFFFGVALSVWSIVYEREDGLINRNIVSGITSYEIMLSYLLTQFLLMCCQAVLIVCFGIFVYHFQCQGSLALTILLMLMQGLCGMFFGFLVSALCEEEITVFIVAVGSLLPMLFLCGIAWPIEGMPRLLRLFAEFLPLTQPVRGLRAIMARGWTVKYFEVYVSFLVSSAWMAVMIVLCVIALRIKKL